MEFTNTEPQTLNKPKFIENVPCGQDLFKGKSQENIGRNIAETIVNDSKCNIIGIDGGWGSGKSNLVRQVQDRVVDKFHFFIYDAWGHQEDLQRRAILEELTDDLILNKLLPENWKGKLQQLLARSREIQTKTVPKLSFGIIISGIAIIMAPICKIVADSIDKNFILIRILVSSLPLLLLLSTVIYYIFKEKSLLKALSNMYILYQNKQREDTTFETISEAEPSVRKFKDWIHNVSKDLHKKGVVLVFDNMDRLPKQKVQQLWSSIHVFFAETYYNNNIKVIIPFDREHIKSAFKTEDIDGDNGNKCFGNDFIDKTFKVVYRVSPPIMSDWKEFFKIQWEKAFGIETYSIDYFKIVQIFDLLSDDITPRKIIAFINEFVAIKLSVKEEIPDKYIALFIFGKQKIAEATSLSEIINPSYLKSLKFLYGNDEEMPKYIASLFYQVDPENAIQVVFTNKLKKGLNENNKEDISLISQINNFYNLLENAIVEVTNFENAILALDTIPKDKIGSSSQYDHIWDCIYKKVEYDNYVQVSDWQLILLKNIPQKTDFAKKVLKGMLSSKDFNVFKYCDSIDKIEEFDKDVFSYLEERRIQIDDWVEYVKTKKKNWKKYLIYCYDSDLSLYFTNNSYEDLENYSFVKYINSDYNIEAYTAKIESLIANISNTTLDKVEIIFKRYKEVSKKPLDKKLTDERIFTFFNSLTTNSDFYYDVLAMRIARLSSFNPSYCSIFDSVLNSENEEIIEKVSAKIEYYLDFNDLLIGLETFSQYPLYRKIVQNLVKKTDDSSILNIVSILPKFDIICASGQIEEETLIKSLNGWSCYAEEDIKASNIRYLTTINFINRAIEINNDLTIHIIKTIQEYLNRLDTPEWTAAFEDSNSYEFNAILKLANYKIPQIAFDSIKEVLNRVALQELEIPDKNKWIIIIERLTSQKRSLLTVFNNVRDIFCRQGNVNIQLFDFFGDWLLKFAKLEDKKETLRTIFKPEIIRNESTLKLIIENKDVMAKIVINAEKEAIDFKDVVQDMLKTNHDENFIEFAKTIGVNKQEEKESEGND